jgi:hypothetical protein
VAGHGGRGQASRSPTSARIILAARGRTRAWGGEAGRGRGVTAGGTHSGGRALSRACLGGRGPLIPTAAALSRRPHARSRTPRFASPPLHLRREHTCLGSPGRAGRERATGGRRAKKKKGSGGVPPRRTWERPGLIFLSHSSHTLLPSSFARPGPEGHTFPLCDRHTGADPYPLNTPAHPPLTPPHIHAPL